MSKPIIPIIESDESRVIASRRGFLKTVAAISLLPLSKVDVLNADTESKTLALKNIHTGDKLKLAYFEQGDYLNEALQEISHLLRDHHTDQVHPIDPALLDQLHDLKLELGIDKPFLISSGYRSPRTNAGLRKGQRGVAKHSLHMQGRAIDFHVDGLEIGKIRNTALAMRRGGVGYSRRAGFVHLDTGSFRSWRM